MKPLWWIEICETVKYVRPMVLIAVLAWTAVFAPVALFAQTQHDRAGSADANDSCVVRYERFAIGIYMKLDRCIQGSNNMGWFDRLVQRTACNAEYISDALQGESEYVSCMSISNIWPK